MSRDGGLKDAETGADGAKILPQGQRDPLTSGAAGGGGEGTRRSQVEWAEKGDGGVCQRNNVGPGCVLGRWRGMVRAE